MISTYTHLNETLEAVLRQKEADGHENATRYRAYLKKLNVYRTTSSVNEYTVYGFLIAPRSLTKPAPVIIYNRGGSKDYGVIGKTTLCRDLLYVAYHGYVVLASQYTGNAGGGGTDELGGMDLEAVLELERDAEALAFCDEERIGMLGESRGGIMTYMALTQSSRIKVALVNCASADLEHTYRMRPELRAYRADMYDTDSAIENKKRSVLHWPDHLPADVSLRIVQGTRDTHVPVEDIRRLCEILAEYSSVFQCTFYEDAHCLPNSRDAYQAEVVRFFGEYL